jgi:hypothetical protein
MLVVISEFGVLLKTVLQNTSRKGCNKDEAKKSIIYNADYLVYEGI